MSENIIGRFLGRLYVFVVKRLRIGAFGISVTSPAASASPSGAGPSRRIRLLFRCIQNALPKKVFEVSLDLIDESPKIHRRCLPATGVRSSGLVSVRLPGFPAKEAS